LSDYQRITNRYESTKYEYESVRMYERNTKVAVGMDLYIRMRNNVRCVCAVTKGYVRR